MAVGELWILERSVVVWVVEKPFASSVNENFGVEEEGHGTHGSGRPSPRRCQSAHHSGGSLRA